MEIAGKLSIRDWAELEKVLKSEEEENWGLAFHFFEERIRTRYLNPIKSLLDMDLNNGEGFAVVNLQCSLIETIESFINGWIYHNDKDSNTKTGWYLRKIETKNQVKIQLKPVIFLKNEDIFISFFKKRESIFGLDVEGLDFYKSVRCGLLHETQTKNGWKIRADGPDKSIDKKIIYRNNFQKDIESIIKNYKESIINGNDFDGIEIKVLRENFISKFNHICEKS